MKRCVVKIYKDCEGYEAVGFILIRKIVLFLRARNLVGRVGEIYFGSTPHKKPIDLMVTNAILKEQLQ